MTRTVLLTDPQPYIMDCAPRKSIARLAAEIVVHTLLVAACVVGAALFWAALFAGA